MSYGLKYTVPFKTISEVGCAVNIEEKGFIGQPVELTAGATPFTIDTDTGDLLTPVRGSGATIQVFGSDYLQDLYTSDPQGVRVTLLVGGVVKWLGYMTPDTFSQDFSNINFTYEIECVSAVSTLKSKLFDLDTDTVSFLALIKRARDLAGYADVYLTSTITSADGQNIYEVAEVSSANFFDELGEAMTYHEILGEIAKYLGCTFVTHGNSLCLIDPFAVKEGMNSYYKYVGDARTTVTLSDTKAITGDDYRATGAKLSRISGRNKIAVNCSLYEIENLIPDIEEGLRPGIGKQEYSWTAPDDKYPIHTIVTVPAWYSGDATVETAYFGLLEKSSKFTEVVRYTEDNIPNKLNFHTELRVQNYWNHAAHDAGNHFTSADWVLRVKTPGKIFVHNKVYFSFFAEVMANMEGTTVSSGYNKTETIDTGLIMVDAWNTASSDTTWPLRLRLRIGEYYYNGSSWSKTVSSFNAGIEIKKDEKKFGRFIPVKDMNDYSQGIGDLSGYIINPPQSTIFGDLELTVYALWPSDFDQHPSSNYGVKYTFMKNIRLEYAVQDLEGVYDFRNKGREDVIYESDISADYSEPAEDVELRICSNVNNKLALSSVVVEGNFLKTINIGSLGYSALPEEGLINKNIQLYSKPRYNINPTLTNTLKPFTTVSTTHLTGAQFLVAGGDEDVKLERCTYNLIEV